MTDIKELAKDYFLLQSKVHRKTNKKPLSVSRGEMAMLGFFTYEQEVATPTELSVKLELSTARVANTLNSLEKKGYVERIHDTKDRRKVTVHATQAGRQFFLQEEENAIADFQELINLIGEEEAEHLSRIIKKINENLE